VNGSDAPLRLEKPDRPDRDEPNAPLDDGHTLVVEAIAEGLAADETTEELAGWLGRAVEAGLIFGSSWPVEGGSLRGFLDGV
jgi:hypothetical protein